MDREEARELGVSSQVAHNNVRNDGFFSLQVILQALQNKGFACYHIGSEQAQGARNNPAAERAFICNRSEHWCVQLQRPHRTSVQVNSTLEKPKHISDTYLAMYIKQLQVDHYSVFVVQGKWPLAPIERQPKPQLTEAVRACTEGAASAPASAHASASFTAFSGGGHSLKETSPAPPLSFDANNDPELAAAIAASLVTNSAPLSADAMRQARLARFG